MYNNQVCWLTRAFVGINVRFVKKLQKMNNFKHCLFNYNGKQFDSYVIRRKTKDVIDDEIYIND